MKSCAIASIVATAIAAYCLVDCRSFDGCVPGETRCVGPIAEICDADGRYHELADCDRVSRQSGSAFTCAAVDVTIGGSRIMGHTCVPAVDAAVVDGATR
jgi:hypothetical protein